PEPARAAGAAAVLHHSWSAATAAANPKSIWAPLAYLAHRAQTQAAAAPSSAWPARCPSRAGRRRAASALRSEASPGKRSAAAEGSEAAVVKRAAAGRAPPERDGSAPTKDTTSRVRFLARG